MMKLMKSQQEVLVYRGFLVCLFIVGFAAILLGGCTQETPQKSVTGNNAQVVQFAIEQPVRQQSGEALFKQYCSSCHPDGGNVSDPRRALYGSALRRNHITTADDIIRIMRNPESRMIRFDVATLPDKNARLIAEYILKTFK